jgi:epoxide hydrolase-like predicted phosphatase
MKKALICDWGGVLMRTVDIGPRLIWERRLGLPFTGLAEAFFGSPAWTRAQLGQATQEQVWEEVERDLGLGQEDSAALRRDFWAGDRLDDEFVSLVRELREQGLHTALLSNFGAELADVLAELELDVFDTVVISALEGVAKPDPAIYQRVLERVGVSPEEAIFVDDWRPNVHAARRLGVTGIRFRGLRHLRRELASAGLQVENPPIAAVEGIKAVIFDWGGVLSPLAFAKLTPRFEERMGLPEGTIGRTLWGLAWKEFETGAISREEYDRRVGEGLGLPDQEAVHEFYRAFFAHDILDPQIVQAVRALRGRYKVAMLTNAFPDHADLLRERYDYDPLEEYDVYVNSALVKLAKPDPAIYRLTLEQLGVEPGEAIFLDDQVRNTDASSELGIHSITYTDPENGLAELAALLGHPL